MDQFVPADWTWSTNKGDAFAPSCAQDDGLVELLWSSNSVVMHSQPPPQPVRGLEAAFVDDDISPEMELFSEIFCQTPAEAGRSSTGKRKQRDATESPSEVMRDVESESAALTKCEVEPSRGKRRRAAQVHNLSERTDKASMLDEAIDYLKSLQLRVQMMWTTGGGMPAPAPEMFPASGPHRSEEQHGRCLCAITVRSHLIIACMNHVYASWVNESVDLLMSDCCYIGQDDGLLSCGGHVAMHSQPPTAAAWEHEAAPWFQYPVVNDPLERDLFSEIFGEMREACSDTAGHREPPRASGATFYRDASTMVTSASPRPKPAGAASRSSGKRKQRDIAESPREITGDAEESDSAVTTCGLVQRPMTSKRRRAAQEHNLSERRRRDRINEKMRALQELVPGCNKTDKASMLDEAIEYLKSLQLQVQMR
ncbi:hypothetical protein ACQ4PT_056111 [Festuca glaucescens]